MRDVGVRVVLLAVFVAVLVGIHWATTFSRSASGEIEHAGDVSLADLRIGDCFDMTGNGTEFTVGSVIGRPCSEGHREELFYAGSMPDEARSLDEDVVQAWSDANCAPAFEAYVGSALNTSTLTIYVYSPVRAAWDSGDRTARCALADRGGQTLTGSMKGSKR